MIPYTSKQKNNCESAMAELEQEMDVDSHPVVPPQGSKSPQPWELSGVRDTITATFTQMLDPIREAVREEISKALPHEQRGVSEEICCRS